MKVSIWSSIFQRFNPIKGIVEHAQLVESASDLLKDLFEKYLNGEDVEGISDEIVRLEAEADRIKDAVRASLKNEVYYGFERLDLLDHIRYQDKIIDAFQDISKLMLLLRVSLPEEGKRRIMEIVDYTEEMFDKFKRAVMDLRNIIESGFAPSEIKREEEDVKLIEGREEKLDEMIFNFGKYLVEQRFEMNCVELFHIREIVLKLAKAADYCENVADRIQIMVRK